MTGAEIAARLSLVVEHSIALLREHRWVELVMASRITLSHFGALDGALDEALAGIETALASADSVEVPDAVWVDARRLLDAGDPDVGLVLARVLLAAGMALDQLERTADALVPYAALLTRFAGSAHELTQRRVATASWNAAVGLEMLGRDAEALAAFEQLASRMGDSEDLYVRARVAWALWRCARLLRQADRVDDAIAVLKDLTSRSDDRSDLELPRWITSEMLKIGGALKRSSRHVEALAMWEEIISRFGDVSGEWVAVRVAWAIWNRASTLEDLHRPEEAIACFEQLSSRFRDSANDDVRVRVSWALWREAQLLRRAGRDAEALPSIKELAARGDERLDTELFGQIGFGMLEIAEAHVGEGRHADALVIYDAVIARMSGQDDAYVRSRAARASMLKAFYLGIDGKHDRAFAAWNDLIDQFGEDDAVNVVAQVLEGICDHADLLCDLGRIEEAIEVLDCALARAGTSKEPDLLRARVLALCTKAGCLMDTGQPEAAVVVSNGAAAAYLDLPPIDRDEQVTRKVVMSVMARTLLADAIHPDSDTVVAQLITILADVGSPSATGAEPAPASLPDNDIAELLSDLYANEYWLEFATAGTDQTSRKDLQARALELFSRTQAWMRPQAFKDDNPADVAVSLIRQIADGYALLANDWHPGYRSELNLPLRVAVEHIMRGTGVDDWAAAAGHPLHLPDPDGLAEQLLEDNVNQRDSAPDFAIEFLKSIRLYEMLTALSDSATGQTVLESGAMTFFAAAELQRSRQLAGQVFPDHEDAAPTVTLGIFIAEALMTAAHQPPQSSEQLFPSPSFLHQALRATDSFEWLAHQAVSLPTWLTS